MNFILHILVRGKHTYTISGIGEPFLTVYIMMISTQKKQTEIMYTYFIYVVYLCTLITFYVVHVLCIMVYNIHVLYIHYLTCIHVISFVVTVYLCSALPMRTIR